MKNLQRESCLENLHVRHKLIAQKTSWKDADNEWSTIHEVENLSQEEGESVSQYDDQYVLEGAISEAFQC